jgi:hypothetical protein
LGLWHWLLQGKHTHQLAVRLQGSNDWSELWRSLTGRAAELGLQTVCLDINAPALHVGYHARWGRPIVTDEAPALWRADLPLIFDGKPVGRLEFGGQRNGASVAETMVELARLTEDVEQALRKVACEHAAAPPPDPTDGMEESVLNCADSLAVDPVRQ